MKCQRKKVGTESKMQIGKSDLKKTKNININNKG